jgi:GT2 family glycosyltransferase
MDNESDMSTREIINMCDTLQLSKDDLFLPSRKNIGYARACNDGARHSKSKYIGIFNSDVEFVNDTCIDQCIDFLDANPDVGVVGPFQFSTVGGETRVTNAGIFGAGDKPQHRGWREVYRGQYRENCEALMVMGSVMIVRREAWDKIAADPIFRKHWPDALGAMPEHDLYYEDTALCYAMPYFGYKVFYLGEMGCEIIHQWHQTISRNPENDVFARSRELFRALMDDWGILHD